MVRIAKNVEFYNLGDYLLSQNVPENRIIILELDDDKNSKYRDPLELGAYIRELCAEDEIYYVFIDEIQKVYSILLKTNNLLKY